MSLLENPIPAHAPTVKRLRVRLRAGNAEARAVLLNLIEEDRVQDSHRAAFHAKLAGATQRYARERFKDAARAAPRPLPLAIPRPGAVRGHWWHHVTLKTLQRFQYLSRAVKIGPSRPPARLPLVRPIGRAASGGGLSLWITTKTGSDADSLRDRLGLCFVKSGSHLYAVRIAMDALPARPLYIPTALDAGWYPAWRRPPSGHAAPWGMTRHLRTDDPSEPELLALPEDTDGRLAQYVGRIATAPPRDYLRARRLP
jgi:hypothetical protein